MKDSEIYAKKKEELKLWDNRIKQEFDFGILCFQIIMYLLVFGLFDVPLVYVVFLAVITPLAIFALTNLCGNTLVGTINYFKKRFYWGKDYKTKEKVWEIKLLINEELDKCSKIKNIVSRLEAFLESTVAKDNIDRMSSFFELELGKILEELKKVDDEFKERGKLDFENVKTIQNRCDIIVRNSKSGVDWLKESFTDAITDIVESIKTIENIAKVAKDKCGNIKNGEIKLALEKDIMTLNNSISKLSDFHFINKDATSNDDLVKLKDCVCDISEISKAFMNKLARYERGEKPEEVLVKNVKEPEKVSVRNVEELEKIPVRNVEKPVEVSQESVANPGVVNSKSM